MFGNLDVAFGTQVVRVYVTMFVAAFRERLKKKEFEWLWTEMVA